VKVFYVPIEVIPNRYTADWPEQFQHEFVTSGIDYVIVGDIETHAIETGSVLDAYATNTYKLKQLDQLIKFIKDGEVEDGDCILIADGWFPGIEALFYIRAMTKKEFYIASIFHAGSYDPYDFVSRNGMRHWAQHQELAWFNGVDIVFVATQFHKDLLVLNSKDFDHTKVIVTGLPFYAKQLQAQYPVAEKENICVFPHRLESEKQPELFDAMAKQLKKQHKGWAFVKTVEATTSREAYFNLLAKAKIAVSFAQQETFGYSILEAMALGCVPIVPNALSYRETVPREYRYRSSASKQLPFALAMFRSIVDQYEQPPVFELSKWEQSIPNMLYVLDVKAKEFMRHRVTQENEVYDKQIDDAAEWFERKEREAEYMADLESQRDVPKDLLGKLEAAND
jgi:hypothetical protein